MNMVWAKYSSVEALDPLGVAVQRSTKEGCYGDDPMNDFKVHMPQSAYRHTCTCRQKYTDVQCSM